jgi:hypothetical protein
MAMPCPSDVGPLFAGASPRRPTLAVEDTIRRLERVLGEGSPARGASVMISREAVVAALDHLVRLTDPTPRARISDPDTSHAAATRAAKCQGAHHRAILRALRMCGPGGGTARDIANRTGWHGSADDGVGPSRPLQRHEVGKRLKELERAGKIERTATVRDGYGVYRLVATTSQPGTEA